MQTGDLSGMPSDLNTGTAHGPGRPGSVIRRNPKNGPTPPRRPRLGPPAARTPRTRTRRPGRSTPGQKPWRPIPRSRQPSGIGAPSLRCRCTTSGRRSAARSRSSRRDGELTATCCAFARQCRHASRPVHSEETLRREQMQTVLGACHRDVEQPALLLDFRRRTGAKRHCGGL
jgi:hypothetical protein